MGYNLFIIITLPLLWLLINLFSFIFTFLYQLAHAIPAFVFKRKPVSVYIGTYGDNNTPRCKLGRLTIYIKPKFFYLKNDGLCLYDTNIKPGLRNIILFAGPLLLFVITCVLFAFAGADGLNTYVLILIWAAFIMALLNLAVNLFPRKLQVKGSKRRHYSDGYLLILLLEDIINYDKVINACRLYDEENYNAALVCLEKINEKYMEESLFSIMLSCYIQLGKYDLANQLQKKYQKATWYELVTPDDYYMFGYAALQTKDYNNALINFDRAIALNATHFNSYNSRAFVYNVLREYDKAKDDAGKAIFINENSSAAFSTRAYANFMLGKTGEASTDADQSLKLDSTNAYAWLIIGMYLLDKGKTAKAAEHFERAKQLNPAMFYVDEYIDRIKQVKVQTTKSNTEISG